MVEAGAFAALGAAAVAELLFWRSARRSGRRRGNGLRWLASRRPTSPPRRVTGLRHLIAHYDRPETAYRARAAAAARAAARLRSPGAARRMAGVSRLPGTRLRPAALTPEQRRAADPSLLGLGHGLRRHRQDPPADRSRAPPAARGHRAAAAPLPDLHQGGRRRDGQAGRRTSSAAWPCCRRRRCRRSSRQLLGRAADAGELGARAHACSRRARPAGRPADHDHPRLLPVAAQALPAGGRGRAAFRGDRAAQRRRSAARGARRRCWRARAADLRTRWPPRRRARRERDRRRPEPCCATIGCGSARCSRAAARLGRWCAALARALELAPGDSARAVRAQLAADPRSTSRLAASAAARSPRATDRRSRPPGSSPPGWRPEPAADRHADLDLPRRSSLSHAAPAEEWIRPAPGRRGGIRCPRPSGCCRLRRAPQGRATHRRATRSAACGSAPP